MTRRYLLSFSHSIVLLLSEEGQGLRICGLKHCCTHSSQKFFPPNLVNEEDSQWQPHRVGDPLLDQELCHKVLNTVRFCLWLNISLAYSCLRLLRLINFLGSGVTGVGEPENTEFGQLLLGGEAVAITSQADSSSKWRCQLYKLERSFRFHLPLLSRTENEDCGGPWYIMCCV